MLTWKFTAEEAYYLLTQSAKYVALMRAMKEPEFGDIKDIPFTYWSDEAIAELFNAQQLHVRKPLRINPKSAIGDEERYSPTTTVEGLGTFLIGRSLEEKEAAKFSSFQEAAIVIYIADRLSTAFTARIPNK